MQVPEPRHDDSNEAERNRERERKAPDATRNREQSREFGGGSKENRSRALTEREKRERWPLG